MVLDWSNTRNPILPYSTSNLHDVLLLACRAKTQISGLDLYSTKVFGGVALLLAQNHCG